MLFLSAEMPNGLGLVFPTRPHGKTAAQLMELVPSDRIWKYAASNGHVSVLQWLQKNISYISHSIRVSVMQEAARGGHIEVLKWLSRRPSGYVSLVSSLPLFFYFISNVLFVLFFFS